ncbi:MAG TPA: hypothetical protein VGD78_19990 [Chthoniobacterales bacterium]
MNGSPTKVSDADYAVYLDYGADSYFGYFNELALDSRGMRLCARWRFAVGTQLALRLSFAGRYAGQPCMEGEITGLVVNCDPHLNGAAAYETTVLFLDVPPSLQEVFDLLAARPELMGNLN